MQLVVDGLVGSGKTLYSVYYAEKHKDEYSKCFTNIKGIKEGSYYRYFDNVLMVKFFDVIRDLYLNKDTLYDTDIKMLQKLIDTGFATDLNSNTLFIFDEAHNYFKKRSEDFLIWFVTYHEHLKINIIFVTQNPKLISQDYYTLSESFIHAIPKIRRMGTSFKYQHNASFPYYGSNTFSHNEFISKKQAQKYFDLYKTGLRPTAKSKSMLTRYYYIVAFLLLLFFGLIWFVLSSFSSTASSEDVHKVFSSDLNNSSSSSHVNKVSSVKVVSIDEESSYSVDIFSYFVDLDKKVLYCNDNTSIPIFFIPTPKYKVINYESLQTFYYRRPLKYCMTKEDNSILSF